MFFLTQITGTQIFLLIHLGIDDRDINDLGRGKGDGVKDLFLILICFSCRNDATHIQWCQLQGPVNFIVLSIALKVLTHRDMHLEIYCRLLSSDT